MIGPSWTDTDDTFFFDYEQMPSFDGPGDWGCRILPDSPIEAFHLTCINDGGVFPTDPNGSEGLILKYPCKDGCDVKEAARIVRRVSDFPDPLRGRDYATAAETQPDNDTNPGAVRFVMATPWRAGDHIVVASIVAMPEDFDDVRKMVRSIYESARG